ncbi:hypothetical protein [Rhodococcus marinonascens]|uniref:hypothetical protein n=1 Tax=Rhodococcus marinonascens TaxID=38311 RepID=UPI000932B012|nr:hypothetical protein [Rhodococcus marinonascens]
MADFGKFAESLMSALRPNLSEQTLDGVDSMLDNGEINQAVIRAIAGAAQEQLSLPPAPHAEVRRRIEEGVSFRPKDANLLRHYFPSIQQVPAV